MHFDHHPACSAKPLPSVATARLGVEFGQLGTEGVEAALALHAQRDPRTAADYQSAAVARALRRQSQDMVDGLLAEIWEEQESKRASATRRRYEAPRHRANGASGRHWS